MGQTEDDYDAADPPSFSTAVPVTIQTPAMGTSTVRVTKDGGYTVSAFAAPTGQTGKKSTHTSVGKETIVVITDLEPSRVMLDHHFARREGTGTDLSKRQGQFTASVDLNADTTDGNLSGEIGSFKTTAMGAGSAATNTDQWLVDLASADTGATGASATIKNLPGSTSSEGNWRSSLVGNHANTDPNDNPSVAVGVFDTRIEDLLHLSGAFGATRQ